MPQLEATAALKTLTESPLLFERDHDLAKPAFELARLIPCTVHDAQYIALALPEDAVMITADSTLVAACREHGLERHVIDLREAASLLIG